MLRSIRFLKLLLLIIAAVSLSACSAIKLAYNQAPDLAYWWLDGYFDFNEQQNPKVRDELAKLHAWHRKEELPRTANWLAEAAQLMPGEVSAQQACRQFDKGRALMDSVIERALPPLAELAPTITPAQLEHLKRKFAKVNEEFVRGQIKGTEAERTARRLKQGIERSETLYGRVEEPQIAVIKAAVAQSSFDASFTLKDRQRRQQEMLAMLSELAATKASPEVAQKALRSYIQRSMESPDAAYRAYIAKLTQEGCQSFAAVHASTNAEQRAKAAKVLKGYEQDLRSLAAAK